MPRNKSKPLQPIYLIISLLIVSNVASGKNAFSSKLVQAAQERTRYSVKYDGSYVAINYPMGDVPLSQGVCTDLIIRAYRVLGIDLQQLVHEDMSNNFSHYPNIWGLRKTDANIDHRRVPKFTNFFQTQWKRINNQSK